MSLFRKASCALCALTLTTAPLAAKMPDKALASAPIFTADGRDAGYAVITTRKDKARLRISLTGMAPGEHGMHFHAVGSCKGDGFSGAGGHLNPYAKMHGSKNPGGSHMGDLPNIMVDANGLALTDVGLEGLSPELIQAMFDKDGASIVIHAGADDYMTDPSGNSGGRIACGVFKHR